MWGYDESRVLGGELYEGALEKEDSAGKEKTTTKPGREKFLLKRVGKMINGWLGVCT